MTEIFILDTSFFFIEQDLEGELYTVPLVLDELKDLRSKTRYDVLITAGLIVKAPSDAGKMAARKASAESGDESVLSETDKSVVALAYDLKGTVVTDDFALSNTAQRLGLVVKPIMQRKAKTRQWINRCIGCYQEYETMPKDNTCPDCGSVIRRTAKKIKNIKEENKKS